MWKIITSLSRGFRQGWQPSGSALWQSPQAQQPLTSTGEGSLNPNTVASTTTCKGHDRHLARLGDDSHTHRESSGAKGNKQNSFQQDNWQSAFQLHQRLYGALRWGAAFVLCMQLWRPLHIHRPCDKEKKKPCIFKTLVAFTQPQGIRRAILPQNSRSTQKHNQNYSTADEPRGNSSVLQKTNTAGKKEGDDHFKAVKLKLAHGTNIVHNVIGLQLVQGSKFESAVKWFETASQDGYSKAQYNLGVCYEQGLGVKQDVKKAAEFYHQAAQRGHAMAQYNLGVLFLDEQFGRSEAEALELLKKAASGGVIQAQSYVGVQCLETHDYDTAFSLLKTATEHKDQEHRTTWACVTRMAGALRQICSSGSGTVLKRRRMMAILAATHSLGYFYEHGLGVTLYLFADGYIANWCYLYDA
ncbi:PREDICTED: death ligand signal enhancer-like [Priapulus caudatus]|uniref:Death ligand signal enhancer-like n=1 Tax=Priapulus caudatus TaxID=37621 RepID=A0ABM1DXA6_PRICU|nr:PREDICTED: death ligand signal enhancer-like [Priapulus caudatus]